MKVTSEQLPKNQIKLTIELATDELKPHLTAAAEKISTTIKIAGFREGKAPLDIVMRHAGEMRVYQEAAELAVKATFPPAVAQEKLKTIGSPDVSVEKIAPNNPFVYTAIVTLLPSTNLCDYKTVKVEKKTVSVEPKEIEDALANLQKMLGKEKRVMRAAQKGDKVEADIQTFRDKIPVDGGESKNQPIQLGEGSFVPGFEDQVVGMKEGETREFTLTFPKEYHQKDMAGRPVEFKVKVNNVFEIEKPELNDEFAKNIGKFEKFDDLKKQIEDNIKREKQDKEQQRWELAMIDAIIEKSTFGDLPQMMIDAELDKMMHELEHNVKDQGMKYDDYLSSIKKSPDDLKKEFLPRAEKRIKAALIMRKIVKEEKITVDDKEIDAEIKVGKERYQDNQDVLKQIGSDEYRDYLKTVLSGRKVFKLLAGKDGK